MALATQCPHCKTTFRVAQDQLKLRAGLVRCGTCKEIFNGIENLLRSDGTTVAPSPSASSVERPVAALAPPVAEPSAAVPTPVEAQLAVPAPPASKQAEVPPTPDAPPVITDFFDLIKKPTAQAAGVQVEKPTSQVVVVSGDPLNPVTAMRLAEANRALDAGEKQNLVVPDEAAPEKHAASSRHTEEIPAPLDPLDMAVKEAERTASSEEIDSIPSDEAEPPIREIEEPSFVTYGRRRQRINRIMRTMTRIGSFVLFVALMAQGAFVFRNLIAGHLPALKPIMAQACAMAGCSLGLPTQIDAIKIESDGPHPLANGKDTFELTALLRNESEIAQGWPHVEMILKDSNGKLVVRRVFAPRDYLASQEDLAKGIPAASEQAVKLFFELSQLKAARFEVDRFYP